MDWGDRGLGATKKILGFAFENTESEARIMHVSSLLLMPAPRRLGSKQMNECDDVVNGSVVVLQG